LVSFAVFLVQTNRRRLGKSTHLYADYVLLWRKPARSGETAERDGEWGAEREG